MSQPAITLTANGGGSFVGTVGVDAFRLIMVLQALKMLKVGLVSTRGMTQGKALMLASNYTGRRYKRGQIDLAISDMETAVKARRETLAEAGQIKVEG